MDRQRWTTGLGTILATVTIAAFLGWLGGTLYGGAYRSADGIMEAVSSFLGAFVGFALLAVISGAVIGASRALLRWTGFAILVVTVCLAILLGFAMTVGFFGPGSAFAQEEAQKGVTNVAAVITLGGMVGFGIGLLAGSVTSRGRPGPAGRADDRTDLRVVADLTVGTVVLALAWSAAQTIPNRLWPASAREAWSLPYQVVVDRDGAIWASGDQLRRFIQGGDGYEPAGEWSGEEHPAFWSGVAVASREGGVWLVDREAGVIRRFDGAGFTAAVAVPADGQRDGRDASDELPWSVAEAPDGTLWAVSGQEESPRVWVLDGSDWKDTNAPAGWVPGLVVGPGGGAWLLGWTDSGGGVARYDGTSWLPAGDSDTRDQGGDLCAFALTPSGDLLRAVDGFPRPQRFDGTAWRTLEGAPPAYGCWAFGEAPSGDLVLLSASGSLVLRGSGTLEPLDVPAGEYWWRPWAALDDGIAFVDEDDRWPGLYVSRRGVTTRIWAPDGAPEPPRAPWTDVPTDDRPWWAGHPGGAASPALAHAPDRAG